MDVSALMGEEYCVWFPYPHGDGGERVLVRYVPLEKHLRFKKKSTEIVFLKHQPHELFDEAKFNLLMGAEAVKDWEGFTVDGEALPCTPENKRIMISKDYEFAEWVMTSCTNLRLLKQSEQEKTEKNSVTTSEQA